MATVMILLPIATINTDKYCCNKKINKTTTADRFDINDKAWKFCSGSFLMIKFLSRI